MSDNIILIMHSSSFKPLLLPLVLFRGDIAFTPLTPVPAHRAPLSVLSFNLLCCSTSSWILLFVLFSVLLQIPFPPSNLQHSILDWDKLTFLSNNAITSMDASYSACMCVSCCTPSVCVCGSVGERERDTHSQWLCRQSLTDCACRENTDAAFCFCTCFKLQFVLLMLW